MPGPGGWPQQESSNYNQRSQYFKDFHENITRWSAVKFAHYCNPSTWNDIRSIVPNNKEQGNIDLATTEDGAMSLEKKSLPEEVLDLLERGNKIEAIKRLRELTHVSLQEAKNLVEGGNSDTAESSARSGEMPSAAIAALHRGNKIEAIRHVREAQLIGLKDAKEFVEAFLDENTSVSKRFEQASAEKLRSAVKTLFAVIIAAALIYFFFHGMQG